jgi:hypothetical protein
MDVIARETGRADRQRMRRVLLRTPVHRPKIVRCAARVQARPLWRFGQLNDASAIKQKRFTAPISMCSGCEQLNPVDANARHPSLVSTHGQTRIAMRS